jgi:hypothetical protein
LRLRHLSGALALLATTIGVASIAGGQNGSLLIADSHPSVDFHAEGQIIAGNIHIRSDKAPDQGTALATCDPDPRQAPNVRPTCAWATPQGSGEDYVDLNGQIGRPDTDSSPNASYGANTTDSREDLDGEGGLRANGTRFLVDDLFEDEDMRFELRPRTIDAYLAPNGNANNRWRRICGTATVGNGDGNARSPFLAGQVRKFVVQIWDADWRDPSDNDGGNQDYYVIDILAPDSQFNTSRCDRADAPPVVPDTPGAPPQQQAAAPGTAPAAATPQGERAASRRLRGAARLAGPGGCQSRAFRATVTGENIAQVVFSLDGRRIATRLRPDSRGRWSTRIVPRRLRAGRHRVEAGVSFVTDAQPRTRRVRLSFQRCLQAQRRVAPRFTG